MPAKIDLTGKKINSLQVEEEAGRDKSGQVMWKCKCDCGKVCYVRGRDLRSGGTKSCGCKDRKRAERLIRKQTVKGSNPNSIRSKKLSKANKSGTRGVCRTKRGLWRATIGYQGKQIFLGDYADKQDAVRERKEAEKRYYKPLLEALGMAEEEEK